MGHEAMTSHDGVTGIATAREFHPDVVLCDIGLPGMDGFEVARRFRADPELREVVLVALSGYAQPEDRHQSSKAGFAHHLAKPADIRELERILSRT
jgi:CheY-like chemotaxis protein